MSSNNNLLLLIIAGVIALIVLHITTSNQSCSSKIQKKNKNKKVVDTPSSAKTDTPISAKIITGNKGDFKNEQKMNSESNSPFSTAQSDISAVSSNSVSQPLQKTPSSLPPPNVASPNVVSSPSSSSSSSAKSSPPAQSSAKSSPPAQSSAKKEKLSENFSYTEQSVLSEGFNNNVMETISEGFSANNPMSESNQFEGFSGNNPMSESNQFEGFSANDAKSVSKSSTGKNPKPDFVIKSASLGNKFGGGNFNVKLTGSSGAIGPNTTNVNGLGVVEGAPDYTLGVTPIISKEKKAKKLTAKDLLPKASKDDWFDMPYDNKQMMRIENENLIAGTATQARIGIDTQGQTLKNASHDLRAAPPNPKFNVGPWN